MDYLSLRRIVAFSVLTFLVLTPSFYLPVLAFGGPESSLVVHYADSLTMPLPAIPLQSSSLFAPVSGVLKVLVLAVTFTDLNNTVSVDELRQAFFGTVGNYYTEVSYGSVSLQGDVVGWYKLNYSMSYYGRDCTNVDDADCSGQPTSWWIARDAVKMAETTVNLNNYDYFVFIHSGVGQESSKNKDAVWSVSYLGGIWLRSQYNSINKFAIMPESEASGAVPIGVYAHEFGHLLGLPDLYNTSTGKSVLGPWSLMDKGLWNGDPPGSSPAHMEAWSKIKLGWMNGSRLVVANAGTVANYTVDPTELSSTAVHAVKIPLSTSTKYYLIEARERTGFDQGLPSTGVLITHVDESGYSKKVTVVNGHPDVPGLENATWNVGQVFTDAEDNLAVAIIGKVGFSYQVTVNRLGPMPDLAVSSISTQPTEVKPNTTVTIIVDVSNQGTESASSVPVQIFLDGQPFASKQVSLDPGKTSEISVSWFAVAGSHEIRVLIDPYNTLTEFSKANNEATFTLNVGPTLIITVPMNATTGEAPAWIRVNGVEFRTNRSSTFRTTVPAGPVTVEVAPYANVSNDTRQAFVGWSDGNAQNPRQMLINSDTSLTAIYGTQYLLTIDPNGGTATPAGWYIANSNITISAASPSNVTEQVTRLLFTGWSGDVDSNSTVLSIVLNKPMTLTANWKRQYYLNVVSSVGEASGVGWYDQGTSATIAIQSVVVMQNNTREVFTGWNDTSNSQDTTRVVLVNAPMVFQASWKRQYQVSVNSLYGNPAGAGWHDAGATIQVSINPQVEYSNRTRRVFDGWAGDYASSNPSITLLVDAPKNLTVRWVTQYQVMFKVSGIANSTHGKLNINNAYHDISITNSYHEWFNKDQPINPIVNETLVDGFLQFRFAGWQNSTGGRVNPPMIIEGPMDYTAVYMQELPLLLIPGFPIESILVGLVMGVLAAGLLRRRKRTPLGA